MDGFYCRSDYHKDQNVSLDSSYLSLNQALLDISQSDDSYMEISDDVA
jgi:hypothetical protein